MVLKTKRRKENEARWAAIYADFLRLSCCGAMKMPVYERIAAKYGMQPNSIVRIVRKMQRGELL